MSKSSEIPDSTPCEACGLSRQQLAIDIERNMLLKSKTSNCCSTFGCVLLWICFIVLFLACVGTGLFAAHEHLDLRSAHKENMALKDRSVTQERNYKINLFKVEMEVKDAMNERLESAKADCKAKTDDYEMRLKHAREFYDNLAKEVKKQGCATLNPSIVPNNLFSSHLNSSFIFAKPPSNDIYLPKAPSHTDNTDKGTTNT